MYKKIKAAIKPLFKDKETYKKVKAAIKKVVDEKDLDTPEVKEFCKLNQQVKNLRRKHGYGPYGEVPEVLRTGEKNPDYDAAVKIEKRMDELRKLIAQQRKKAGFIKN